MTNLTGAHQRLTALIELLHIYGGLALTARIQHLPSIEASARPELLVELDGRDTPLLISRNGELLHAIEHVAAKVLGLEPDEQDRISLDAAGFNARRERELQRMASAAVIEVRTTATAHVFPPMTPRERRLLHLALAPSGLKTASTGERLERCVVLYPEGVIPAPGKASGAGSADAPL